MHDDPLRLYIRKVRPRRDGPGFYLCTKFVGRATACHHPNSAPGKKAARKPLLLIYAALSGRLRFSNQRTHRRATGVLAYNRLLRQLKQPLRRLTVRRYQSEPWFKAIISCQAEIAASNPSPRYVQGYMQDEISYWLRIPEWLYEDQSEPGQRCLDIGSAYGTLGLFCRKTLGARVWCTDIREDYMSQVLIDRHGFDFVVHNVELEPFPWDIKFDVIILTEVLEHFNFHPVSTLRRIRESLKIDGNLYMSTPDAAEWGREENRFQSYEDMPSADETLPLHDGHIYIYDEEELLAIAEEAGLVVERLDYAPGIAGRHLNLQLTVRRDPL